jgi:hypothetical protein
MCCGGDTVSNEVAVVIGHRQELSLVASNDDAVIKLKAGRCRDLPSVGGF